MSGEDAEAGGKSASLTSEEVAVLDFEKSWKGRSTRKNDAIQAMGMAPSHYYLVLGRVIEKPEALMEEPELVRRLRRLREQRAAERHGTRNSSVSGGDVTGGNTIG